MTTVVGDEENARNKLCSESDLELKNLYGQILQSLQNLQPEKTQPAKGGGDKVLTQPSDAEKILTADNATEGTTRKKPHLTLDPDNLQNIDQEREKFLENIDLASGSSNNGSSLGEESPVLILPPPVRNACGRVTSAMWG